MSDELRFHPLADIFPLMGGDEFDELVADIKANGLLEEIVLYDGTILDGRNRYRACLAAEVVPTTINVDKRIKDPAAYVISANIHRRHLTAEQKRELVAKLLKAQPENSNNAVAKQVKVDDKTVAKVRRKLESTSEIPKLEKTVGTDGKARKAKKTRTASAAAREKARERRDEKRKKKWEAEAKAAEIEEAKAEAKATQLATDLLKASLAERVLAYLTWEDDQRLLQDALKRALSPDGEIGNADAPEASAEDMKAKSAEMDTPAAAETPVITAAAETTSEPLAGNDPGPIPACLDRTRRGEAA